MAAITSWRRLNHSLILMEHDPLLYEDATKMAEYVPLAQKEVAKEATVLLYAPGADPYFEKLVKNANRVFYFDEGPRVEARVVAKANARAQRSQTTLEAFT